MPKAKITVKKSTSNNGTKLAVQRVRVVKTDGAVKPKGKPLLQTRAQIAIDIRVNRGGQQRQYAR